MGKNKIRFGVLGTGKIGRLHLDSLINYNPDAEVVLVADPYMSAETEEWLKGYDMAVTKNSEEVINNDDVEAVMILTPTDTHAAFVEQAAIAGKHIFCEKPVDFDLDKIIKALQTVKDSGVKFQIGFNRRFDHNFARVRSVVESGEIGDPHITKISSRDPAPPPMAYIKSSGGIFMDQMIHDFDMIRFLTGKEVVSVFSKGSVKIKEEIGEVGDVDTAVVVLEFADGSIGVIDNSRQAVYGYDQRAEVFGSNGVCLADNDTATRVTTITTEGANSDVPPYFFLERYFQAYVDEVKSFISDLQNDKDPSCGLFDAIQPVIIAKAATLSQKTGKPVKIDEILSLDKLGFLQ
ncbi:MAG: inositol 2-dehydrogenase [Bacteroidetes bacterium]|nr:inositol 2-dehydrogenase [Bacteroidota bacterium]